VGDPNRLLCGGPTIHGLWLARCAVEH